MATVAICPLFDPIFSEIRDYKCRLSDFSTSKEHSVVIAVFLKSECVFVCIRVMIRVLQLCHVMSCAMKDKKRNKKSNFTELLLCNTVTHGSSQTVTHKHTHTKIITPKIHKLNGTKLSTKYEI